MADKTFRYSYLIISLVIIIVFVSGYFFYDKIINRPINTINAIPANSIMFFETDSPIEFYNKLDTNNKIWQALSGTSSINTISKRMDFFNRSFKNNKKAIEIIDKSHIYISVHSTDNNSIDVLFLIGLPGTGYKNFIGDLINDIYGLDFVIKKNKYMGTDINEVVFPGNNINFHYTVKKGIFIGSYNDQLIKQSLDQIGKEKPLSNNLSFKKVSKTTGKNVDGNLYINLNKINHFLKPNTNKDYRSTIDLLQGFAHWSALDIVLKNDKFLFNGYTGASDTAGRFLNLFRDQQSQKIVMTRILPFNTNMLLWFGFDNFSDFYENFEEYLRHNKRFDDHYNEILRLNNRYKINLERNMLSWVDNEMAVVSLAKRSNDIPARSLAIFHAKNPSEANKSLTQLINSIRGSKKIKTYKNHILKYINLPDLLGTIFGPSFGNIDKTYFTIIEDYVVFANNTTILEEFINTFIAGKTLTGNINYQDFSDNISETSNVYFYVNSRNSIPVISHYLSKEISQVLEQNKSIFENFHAFAIQFSNLNNMFYTNMYIKYNPGYMKENMAVWKTMLEAEVVKKPYLLKDHTDNTYNIIVIDKDNRIYLVDNNGNILWKKTLAANVISDVYPVDYYKNRKIQYLFNTPDQLMLIDILGRHVENYPIQLGTKASNGLALFDYINNKNYRIIFAGEDNRIYDYNIKGNAVKGWVKPKVNSTVKNKIQHLIAYNKDYIIIPQLNGDVKITERRGNTRIRIRDPFKNALNSDFYVNKTNNKGVLLTTDQNGHLTYIKRNGHLDRTVFKDFSPDHFFLYEDIDKNGHKDFIFLDGNKLVVFDRFKNVLFEYEFINPIRHKPKIIPVSYRENLLGIVDSEENKLYIFNHKGNLVFGSGLAGETQFSTGSLNNDNNLNLLVGSGNTLYNYLIK